MGVNNLTNRYNEFKIIHETESEFGVNIWEAQPRSPRRVSKRRDWGGRRSLAAGVWAIRGIAQ
jgi:hypothetical protein